MAKRSLVIKHNDGSQDKELEIGKAAVVHSPKEFIYFEKMDNGEWRLTFSSSVVPDFSTIESFKVERQE